jgi:hypothetical protein
MGRAEQNTEGIRPVEKNRKSDAPQGTGQLPACEPTGWPYVEAQGRRGVTTTFAST